MANEARYVTLEQAWWTLFYRKHDSEGHFLRISKIAGSLVTAWGKKDLEKTKSQSQ